MTIKLRIILGFLVTTIAMSASIVAYVTYAMRHEAESEYALSSQRQLDLMNNNVTNFINTAKRSIALLAKDPHMTAAGRFFPNYSQTTKESQHRHADLSPEARQVLLPIARMAKENPDYVDIYLAYEDGSFAWPTDDRSFPPGFNMSLRPWYMARARASEVVGLSESYQSTTGEMVFAITHKMFDSEGRFSGVAGVDVSLKGLSETFRKLNFGNTGYFLLVEQTGRILCNPKKADSIGKVIGKDIADPSLTRLFDTGNGIIVARVDGADMRANIKTLDNGWKIVALQAESEIFSATDSAMRSICLLSAGIALAVLALAFLIVRSITRPLNVLVLSAKQIAQGDLSTSLDSKGFYGELASLRAALSHMVNNLQEMIVTAEQKSKDAENQTCLAKAATEQAEIARKDSENARHEGTMAAAAQLEEVVAIISDASNTLASRIEQADQGASVSAQRLAEAATAMNEMNATVQEVARSASTASSMSNETRTNAENGEKIVQNALKSIGQVHTVSLSLKQDMARLNEHAQAITHIMSVISDIADQTNLLALNAAIEAARAGDAGRGFAVVADEVRKLAEKTMDSTKDVSNAITAIQSSALQSVAAMDKTLEQVQTATGFAHQSGEALGQIVGNVEATVDQVNAIATASEEQSAASEEINASIVHINNVVGQTAQAMGGASEMVDELTRQIKRLGDLIVTMKKS